MCKVIDKRAYVWYIEYKSLVHKNVKQNTTYQGLVRSTDSGLAVTKIY